MVLLVGYGHSLWQVGKIEERGNASSLEMHFIRRFGAEQGASLDLGLRLKQTAQ